MGSGPLRAGEVFLFLFFLALGLLSIPFVCGAAFWPSLIYFLLLPIKKKIMLLEQK